MEESKKNSALIVNDEESNIMAPARIFMRCSCLFLAVMICLTIVSGCDKRAAQQDDISFWNLSYQDIPGVTDEEIDAIHMLRGRYGFFIYGMNLSTETFYGDAGEIKGFTALFCDWLTDLFDIPFNPAVYEWGDLIAGLENGEISFSGELTATEERRENGYIMTDPIVERPVRYMRLNGSIPLSEIAATRQLRYAFLADTTTADEVALLAYEQYEPYYVEDYDTAYSMLKNGEIDAFFDEGPAEAAFDIYGDVIAQDFLPLIYSPISLATQNRELEPIISVIQKALKSGALHHLTDLYNTGQHEYKKHKLRVQLTDDELAFIQNNPIVPFAAEYDNYPVSFYDTRYQEWQGIAFDVINEIELLTGLTFEVVNDQHTLWPDLLKMFEEGNAAMISELIPTKEREGLYLWPQTPILTDYYALISKSDFRNVNINEVLSLRVGLAKDTAHTALFQSWFPNHMNTVDYESSDLAFEGLAQGEVDLVMASQSQLLILTNYRELAGYKANIIFDRSFESSFGFNKESSVLCSIVDKALRQIDTKLIANQWTRKTYDYTAKLAQAQRPWLIGASILLLFIIILLFVLFRKTRSEGKRLESLVQTRTARLEAIQKELETAVVDAEAANRAKSVFLATMSHEIRTPMNSIMGFAELALSYAILPEVKEYLGKITDSTKWLLRIINDILDISKIESGRIEFESVPFDLHSIFTRCQSVVQPSVDEKGLELHVYAEPTIGKWLMGDPVRLYQALMNLLSNAVKFTDSGTVKMSSSVLSTDGNTIKIYFEIKDSGVGMAPEQIEKIFKPFVQADSSTTRNYGGTGLGLAITKNIVELMGGKLMVESEPGRGSTFSFEIAFESVDAPDDISGQTDFNLIEKPHFDGLVLVCEDNNMNQQVIREHLARVGLQTVIADNGSIGLELVQERVRTRQKPFDLILMDIFMPVMDGVEAATKITALGTGTPIIAMTANIMSSELDNYKQSGMTDYIGKPFTTQDLWLCLLKYLVPVSVSAIGEKAHTREYDKLQADLRVKFVEDNQTVFFEISNAIDTGDTELAHRLTHSLKTNAGMIGKTALQNAAADVEAELQQMQKAECTMQNCSEALLSTLKNELEMVLEELRPLLIQDIPNSELRILDSEQTLELFEELEPMLKSRNPECLTLLNDLRLIPGTEELVQQVEKYRFKLAAETLAELKKNRG